MFGRETFKIKRSMTKRNTAVEWKVLLIKAIAKQCPKRFGELRREMEDLAQTTLTVQLRELERDGILCRQIYAESPPRVEYKLSELGKTLLPVIERLDEW